MMLNEKGFSLVELLTVLAVVGLMSAIAVPSYLSGMPKKRLKAATRELYGFMQQARLLAVKDSQRRTMRFEKSFCYRDDNNNKRCDPGEKRVDLAKYHDVEFGGGAAKKNWNGDPIAQASSITFSPEGTANSHSVHLQNISAPLESFAITSQTSGAIKIRWFDGSKWK
jgi:type II secretion system protein H